MLGHLISFRSNPERIMFWNSSEACELALAGQSLSIVFSDSLLCTGYRNLEGNLRCPHGIRGMKQCAHCKNQDILKVYTRLDFTGYEAMQEEYVRQEFSVYLAAFGDSIVKCGVTRSGRVEERTREQGADFWIELMRFDNGENAYAAENALQRRFGLRNFVRNSTKLELLGKPRSKTALEAKVKEILLQSEALADSGGVLAKQGIRENVFPVPQSFEIASSIEGTVTGSKAQMLFYENGGKHFVVPMSDSIGKVFLLKERGGSG